MADILGGDPNPVVTQPADALSTLVGEGKKFKDIEALAKSKLEADSFIAKLTDETTQLRTELEKRMNLEEQLARLARGDNADTGGNQPPGTDNQAGATVAKPEDVEALLDRKLRDRDLNATKQANLRQVNEFLLKHFGDENKAKDAVAQLNASLGINLTELASVSPAAVTKLIAGAPSGSGLPAEHGTVNLGFSNGEVRNKAYYEKQRREMGNARFYNDKRLQVQLHKDAQKLGDAFYN